MMAAPEMGTDGLAAALRGLPAVDAVLLRPEVAALLATWPRWAVLEVVRGGIERLRRGLLDGVAQLGPSFPEGVDLGHAVDALLRPSLRPVLNAIGVVLHTNFGRAP